MIDIRGIRKYVEDNINKEVDEIDQPNLNREKKRIIVLSQMNTSKTYSDEISFPNNTFILFDIKKVRDFREKLIEEIIRNIEDDKLSEKQKRLKVLAEMNSSNNSSETEEELKSNINIDKGENMKEEKKIKETDNQNSTMEDSTMISAGNSTMESLSIIHSTGISEFTKEKKNYWIKYGLYDVKVPTNLKGLIICSLDEEKGEEKYCYFYYNKLTTYYYIQNIKFGENYSINENFETDNNYNSSLGLFFCGKKIELENEETKRCNPNEMICKECMEKDKKRYNLQSYNLVNINGRAAKKNKKSFHCFGHFMVGNQIENCLQKFSCEACKLLDKYEQYYFPS